MLKICLHLPSPSALRLIHLLAVPCRLQRGCCTHTELGLGTTAGLLPAVWCQCPRGWGRKTFPSALRPPLADSGMAWNPPNWVLFSVCQMLEQTLAKLHVFHVCSDGWCTKAFYCHRVGCKLGHRRWYNKSRGPSFAREVREGCMVLQAKHFKVLIC